jgi:bifunctional DNA-binding transcriptional regulator/antitoxin component of YhaV-PrlF toxin-antitoxin module
MKLKRNLEVFWDWFRSAADALSRDPRDTAAVKELDRRVRLLDSQLEWELGPGETTKSCLTISPGRNPQMVALAKNVISEAPRLHGWEFNAIRRPKAWKRQFGIQRGDRLLMVDASDWRFVLLKYEDESVEIVLVNDVQSDEFTDAEMEEMAATFLESELGEQTLLDPLILYSLVDTVEPEWLNALRPVNELASALGQNRRI